MTRFIDVFYVPKVDPSTPYRCFVWQGSDIAASSRHKDMAEAVEWCKRQALPVRVYDPEIQADFINKGVPAQLSGERAVGQ